jgi:hypothetical protein
MVTSLARAAALTLALGMSQAAMAVTAFDNGAPDLVSGTQMSEFRVAEDFTLLGTTVISNIRFWSIQSSPSDYLGSVAWSILSDAGTQPGAAVSSGLATVPGTATGGTTGFGYAAYSFDIPVSVSLPAGNYWLALHNGPLTATAPMEMLWATSGFGSGSSGLYFDAGSWVNTGNQHAFRLDSVAVVPEPGAGAMLLAGLMVVGGLGIRRRAGNHTSR